MTSTEMSRFVEEPLSLALAIEELGPRAPGRFIEARLTLGRVAMPVWGHLGCLQQFDDGVGFFSIGFVLWCCSSAPPDLDTLCYVCGERIVGEQGAG